MKFLILKPPSPIDFRRATIESIDVLHAAAPVVLECKSEREAMRYVRTQIADAVGMPFPIRIGAGQTYLLGFVDNWRIKFDPDHDIPFVTFVQPVSESDADRQALKKGPPFNRTTWKVPVVKPDLYKIHDVEIRASDLEAPAYAGARVGYRDGRMTIYAEIGGVEMSVTFDDPNLWLADRSPNKPGRLEPELASDAPVTIVR